MATLIAFECTVGKHTYKGHDATTKTVVQWLLDAEEYDGTYVVLNTFPLTEEEFALIDGKLSSMTEDLTDGEDGEGGCVECGP